MERSMRIFATQADLQTIFTTLQQELQVYYVPTYSNDQPERIMNIMDIPDFGLNTRGSHIGNSQFLLFYQGTPCYWRETDNKNSARVSSLNERNTECVAVDLGGAYDEVNLLPTSISTIHYENEASKKLFNALKKIVRKNTSKIQNGYLICEQAYRNREEYRFCTIGVHSPQEYDLIIE